MKKLFKTLILLAFINAHCSDTEPQEKTRKQLKQKNLPSMPAVVEASGSTNPESGISNMDRVFKQKGNHEKIINLSFPNI